MTQELSDVVESKSEDELINKRNIRLFDQDNKNYLRLYFGRNKFVAAGNFVLNEFNGNYESLKNPNPNYHSILGFIAEAIKYPVLIFTSSVLALPMYIGGVCMLKKIKEGAYGF